MKAWLGVVSHAHVRRGVSGGFAQLCHGKEQPLHRMQAGDWLVYYSPSVEMGGAPLRAFTAIGRVGDGDVYRHDMGGGFIPFRRDVRYVESREVALDTIKDRLMLCAKGNWGMALRRGHLPLANKDFAVIASAMQAHAALAVLEGAQ